MYGILCVRFRGTPQKQLPNAAALWGHVRAAGDPGLTATAQRAPSPGWMVWKEKPHPVSKSLAGLVTGLAQVMFCSNIMYVHSSMCVLGPGNEPMQRTVQCITQYSAVC